MPFPIRFKHPRFTFVVLALLALVGIAGLTVWLLRQPQSNRFDRGWVTAQRVGCFACHGGAGREGANNPGSDELLVPSWDGGMLFMYVENTEEIGEWIEFGVPHRLRPDAYVHASAGSPAEENHPGQHGLLPMPAFGAVLGRHEIDDLIALVRKTGN